MALLHRHAASWRPPAGSVLPVFDEPLFGDEDLLGSARGLSVDGRAVIDQAGEVMADAFAAVHDGATLRPVDADLHGGNLKWSGDRLAVFDFDDSGLGLPVVDLAVTTLHLRGGDPGPERAQREGYADVAPVPEVDPAHFEALVAARLVLLANSLWRARPLTCGARQGSTSPSRSTGCGTGSRPAGSPERFPRAERLASSSVGEPPAGFSLADSLSPGMKS